MRDHCCNLQELNKSWGLQHIDRSSTCKDSVQLTSDIHCQHKQMGSDTSQR
jgi:hypothetical protein